MKCELGKTYVCRNGLIKTLYDEDENGYLSDYRYSYYYGKAEMGSEVFPGSDQVHPHDIVCELMKG